MVTGGQRRTRPVAFSWPSALLTIRHRLRKMIVGGTSARGGVFRWRCGAISVSA